MTGYQTQGYRQQQCQHQPSGGHGQGFQRGLAQQGEKARRQFRRPETGQKARKDIKIARIDQGSEIELGQYQTGPEHQQGENGQQQPGQGGWIAGAAMDPDVGTAQVHRRGASRDAAASDDSGSARADSLKLSLLYSWSSSAWETRSAGRSNNTCPARRPMIRGKCRSARSTACRLATRLIWRSAATLPSTFSVWSASTGSIAETGSSANSKSAR